MSALLTTRTNIKGLRGKNKLQLLPSNAISYGTSFKFYASKLWNILNDDLDLRTTASMSYFRHIVDLANCIDFVN